MPLIRYISDIPLYSTKQEALSWGAKRRIKGFHTHKNSDGSIGYMAGWNHKASTRAERLNDRRIQSSVTDPSRVNVSVPLVEISNEVTVDQQIVDVKDVDKTKLQILLSKKIHSLKDAINVLTESINRLTKGIEDNPKLEAKINKKIRQIKFSQEQLIEQLEKIKSFSAEQSAEYIKESLEALEEPGSTSSYIVDVTGAATAIADAQSELPEVGLDEVDTDERDEIQEDIEREQRERERREALEAERRLAEEKYKREKEERDRRAAELEALTKEDPKYGTSSGGY